MSYQNVPTVSTGDFWSAVDHNTYVRDNFSAGVPGLFAAKGDMAVGLGAANAGRLSANVDYSILFAKSSETGGVRRAPLSEQLLVFHLAAPTSGYSYTATGGTWTTIPYTTLQFNSPFTAHGVILATGYMQCYSPGGSSKVRLITDSVVSPENLYYSTLATDVWLPFAVLMYKGYSSGNHEVLFQGYSDNGARIYWQETNVFLWKMS